MSKETNDEQSPVGENTSGETRRSAVKKIVLTTGIVTTSQFADVKWTKPIIDSVVLPAHAQTSPGADSDVNGY